VRNLIANAVDAQRAAEPHDRSRSPLTRDAGAAGEIAVADRGAGVPPELAERLFEPFVSGRPGGVGLGLALVRRIALLHGGDLGVASRARAAAAASCSDLPADLGERHFDT
jgi:signal transduction histidine kinase